MDWETPNTRSAGEMNIKKQGELITIQSTPVFTGTAVVSHFDDPLGRMLTEYDEYLEGKRPYESLRIYTVVKETASGSQIISVSLSEEERNRLRVDVCPTCMTRHDMGYCEPRMRPSCDGLCNDDPNYGAKYVKLPMAYVGRRRPGNLRRFIGWLIHSMKGFS
jgi:hypothetical protein